MKIRSLTSILTALSFFFLNAASAQEVPAEATVTASAGSSSAKLPDGSVVPTTVGLKLPPGTAVVTGVDAQLSVRMHDGIVVVFAGHTQASIEKLSVSADGVRNTVVNLKYGSLASSLDPARKNENNFGVRTEKGMARAHGTTLTVSVANNVYTVSVLAGNVTVNWGDGITVNIVGNTPSDVTSNLSGQFGASSSLGAALAAHSPGLADALTAAAAAVATVATNPAQVTNVINTIAAATGSGPSATSAVARATAVAIEAALTNSALSTPGTDSTAIASIISTAAVASATNAGNGGASARIVAAAVGAIAHSSPTTNLEAAGTSLASAANSVQGATTVTPNQVSAAVRVAQNPPALSPVNLVNVTLVTPNDALAVSPAG